VEIEFASDQREQALRRLEAENSALARVSWGPDASVLLDE
jgi:hypothetical protein